MDSTPKKKKGAPLKAIQKRGKALRTTSDFHFILTRLGLPTENS